MRGVVRIGAVTGMSIGKFGGGGFAKHQCACLSTECHAGSVCNGAMADIDARSVRSRQIGRINHVLKANRDAMEQAGAGRGIGAFRAGDRSLGVELDPRVHQGIPMLDAFKTASHKGFSAQVASGDLGRCFDGGQAMRFASHGSFSIRVQTGTILQTRSPVHEGTGNRHSAMRLMPPG